VLLVALFSTQWLFDCSSEPQRIICRCVHLLSFAVSSDELSGELSDRPKADPGSGLRFFFSFLWNQFHPLASGNLYLSGESEPFAAVLSDAADRTVSDWPCMDYALS